MTRIACLVVLAFAATALCADTFIPYQPGRVPDNAVDLWANYAPAKESLDVEVVKEWDVDEIIVRYVRFTVLKSKGTPSRLAAYYTFPKGLKHGPAFVWCHGGGQRAEKERGLHFAKQGYAVLDINWGGRSMEEDITINTDWGKVDPSQGPQFYPGAAETRQSRFGPGRAYHRLDPQSTQFKLVHPERGRATGDHFSAAATRSCPR